MQDIDWQKANKKQLLEKLVPLLQENVRLRDSVGRLMKTRGEPFVIQHHGHEDDFVPAGWAERHCIKIPRADGFFESKVGWVRIRNGVITMAGLKNQSILESLISRELLDAGSENQANVYSDWRAAFFSRVEAARYSDSGVGNPDAWSKEDRFSKLLKAVDRVQLRYVDILITRHPKEKDVGIANTDPQPFIRAFEKMALAMAQINRDAADALKV